MKIVLNDLLPSDMDAGLEEWTTVLLGESSVALIGSQKVVISAVGETSAGDTLWAEVHAVDASYPAPNFSLQFDDNWRGRTDIRDRAIWTHSLR